MNPPDVAVTGEGSARAPAEGAVRAEPTPTGLPDPELTENARTVLARRYLKKDETGEPIEAPRDLFWRVARVIAGEDRSYGATDRAVAETAERFYRLMAEGVFEPNSPTLMNAGRPLGQLSACFVLPVPDSLDGIYETLRDMALIHQSGGGTGFGFSRLRPKGDVVKSTMGVASGPVSFMEVYDASTEAVKQGGCVVPDTLVSTDRGLVPIRELGPSEGEPDSWHRHVEPLTVATDTRPRVSDEFYVHGPGRVRRLRTRCGYGVAATPEHRLRVIDDEGRYVWRRMRDIEPGDWVVLQKGHLLEPDDDALPGLARTPHPNAKEVRLPTRASELLGEFLGYLIGDGAFNRYNVGGGTGRLILTVSDDQPEVTRWLHRACEELFGISPIAQSKEGDRSTNHYLNATTLVNWLEGLGVEKPAAHEARMPAVVFRKGKALARGFLRGLFTADGSVSPDGYPSLSSVSPGLVEDVQQLLLAVGIPSGVSRTDDRTAAFGSRPLYRLRVVTLAGLEVFARTVGFLDSRRRDLLSDGSDKAWERNDVIPHPGLRLATAYAGPGRGSGPGRGTRGANRELYRDIQHYLPGVTASRNLTRSRLTALAEAHEEIRSSDLVCFLSNDQFYDRVDRVEEDESPTLDLSVPDGHTYVANGFVSHNTRRGANMGILRVDHPDILDFIDCKADKTKITNFNISIAVTDAFMEAARAGEEYDLVNPRTGETVGRLNAADVFAKIVHGAWRNGEPGVFFIDEANRHNPVPHLGPYEATNPCGEQVLLAYDVCNLGSVNVGHFVSDEGRIDWDGLGSAVRDATHFLDNVIDANRYPLEKIDRLSKQIRRIGLGIMGWADLLVKVGEPYGSLRSIELGREVMAFVDEEAKRESERLAAERGVFPEWERSIWGPDETCARDEKGERIRPKRRLRNCNLTTVAPTGTISIIAGCSSGIEPLFAVAFMRNQAGVLMPDVNPEFVRRAKEGGWYSEELMERIADEGHIHFDEVPEEVQGIFVTAHDVTPEEHTRMQAAFQSHTDAAISKTCNFPSSATKEDVREIYELAHRLRCKGVTVYRDGSRDEQVLSTGRTAKDVEGRARASAAAVGPESALEHVEMDARLAADMADALARLASSEAQNQELREQNRQLGDEVERKAHRIAELEGGKMKRVGLRERPAVLRGHTRRIESPLGTMYVTINEDDQGRPFEVFVGLGKTGGAAMADAEAIGRLISLALRSGITLRQIHKQLRGISSDRAVGLGPSKVLSGPDAVAQVIEKYLDEKEGVQQSLPIKEVAEEKPTNGGAQTSRRPVIQRYQESAARLFMGVCSECGSSMAFEEGCAKCYACGHSECG